MDKKPRSFEIYAAFLSCYVAEGIEKIPYSMVRFDKAFYDIIIEHPELRSEWGLLKRDNPQVRKLDDLDYSFGQMGITSFDLSNFPNTTIDVNKERLDNCDFHPTETEFGLAHKIHNLYEELMH